VRVILHGYPPDKQEKAIRTVLEQAEGLSEAWAVARVGGSGIEERRSHRKVEMIR
jgi:hypothetical protein